MREKSIYLHMRVSPAELARIDQKREESGIANRSAYIRKMALDGYCVNLDLTDVKEMTSLLRRCNNNLNQYAKRANETGSIYLEDIRDVQARLDAVWEQQKLLLKKLAAIR